MAVRHSFNNQRLQMCSQLRSVVKACFGSVKSMHLPTPLYGMFREEHASSYSVVFVVTQFLLSACCLIRNMITADPDGLFGTEQCPQKDTRNAHVTTATGIHVVL